MHADYPADQPQVTHSLPPGVQHYECWLCGKPYAATCDMGCCEPCKDVFYGGGCAAMRGALHVLAARVKRLEEQVANGNKR